MGRLPQRDWLGTGDHATRVTARTLDEGPAPIVVERRMTWQTDQREAHASPGVSTLAPVWTFAEGGEGYFATYVAILNPQATPSTVRLEYLHENGTIYPETVTVAAEARATVWVTMPPPGTFAIRVIDESGRGMAVERMLYGGDGWTVGHAGWASSRRRRGG